MKQQFDLIIPEFNGRAIAQRYYEIVHPEREYAGDQAWRQLKQDRQLKRKVLQTIVREFAKKQQKNIANYFAVKKTL